MSAVLGPLRSPGGHGQILQAVWRATRVLGGVLLGSLLLMLVLVAVFSGRHALAVTVGPACGVAMVAGWWMAFFALQAQNHPVAARLVPGQLRQLREISVVMFIGLSLLCGGGFALAGLPGTAGIITVASILTALGLATRWPWLWAIGWVVPFCVAQWMPPAMRTWIWLRLRDIHDAQPVSMAAFVLMMLSVVICKLFQAGRVAHERNWQRAYLVKRLVRDQVGIGWYVGPPPSLSGKVTGGFSWLRNLWREHLMRSAKSTTQSAMARVELGANPSSHWSLVVGSSVVVLSTILVLIAITLAVVGGNVPEGLRNTAQGLAFGVISMMVNPALTATVTLFKRRREQALLVLLPGVPRGVALNRHLARRQMIQFSGCWALGIAAVLIIELVVGRMAGSSNEGAARLLGWAFNYAALTLPLGVTQWRNWSIQGTPNRAVTVIYVVLLICGMAALEALTKPLALTHGHVLMLSVVITVALMVWRWPVVTRSPSFWPVGRWS